MGQDARVFRDASLSTPGGEDEDVVIVAAHDNGGALDLPLLDRCAQSSCACGIRTCRSLPQLRDVGKLDCQQGPKPAVVNGIGVAARGAGVRWVQEYSACYLSHRPCDALSRLSPFPVDRLDSVHFPCYCTSRASPLRQPHTQPFQENLQVHNGSAIRTSLCCTP